MITARTNGKGRWTSLNTMKWWQDSDKGVSITNSFCKPRSWNKTVSRGYLQAGGHKAHELRESKNQGQGVNIWFYYSWVARNRWHHLGSAIGSEFVYDKICAQKLIIFLGRTTLLQPEPFQVLPSFHVWSTPCTKDIGSMGSNRSTFHDKWRCMIAVGNNQ